MSFSSFLLTNYLKQCCLQDNLKVLKKSYNNLLSYTLKVLKKLNKIYCLDYQPYCNNTKFIVDSVIHTGNCLCLDI